MAELIEINQDNQRHIAVLCGVESHGMILAADAGENDVRVIFVDDLPAGAKIR